jgi:hypothetical protein
LGLAAALAFVGLFGWFLALVLENLPDWMAQLAREIPVRLDQNLLVALAVAVIFVAMGLAATAFRRQIRRVLLLA